VNCAQKSLCGFTPAPVPLSIFVSPSEIASASRVQGSYPAGGFTPVTRLAFQNSLMRVCFQESVAWLKKNIVGGQEETRCMGANCDLFIFMCGYCLMSQKIIFLEKSQGKKFAMHDGDILLIELNILWSISSVIFLAICTFFIINSCST
jgi:muramoyltetrapeptide carboxypeptidase LdcA involved in peptidoglycan recycling